MTDTNNTPTITTLYAVWSPSDSFGQIDQTPCVRYHGFFRTMQGAEAANAVRAANRYLGAANIKAIACVVVGGEAFPIGEGHAIAA